MQGDGGVWRKVGWGGVGYGGGALIPYDYFGRTFTEHGEEPIASSG